MLIVCPSCLIAYRLPPEAGPAVATVRCAQCGGLFTPSALMPMARLTSPEPRPVQAIAPPELLPATRPMRSLPWTEPEAAPRRTGAAVLALLAVGLGLGMGGVAWRAQLVQALPISATLFAAVGLPTTAPSLSLGTVATALADEGSTRVLTLEGSITNGLATAADVPNLRIVVRDDAAQAVYSWVTAAPQPRLAPGEAVSFRSRLVSPPANGHDLVVSFADRTDGGATTEVKTAP